KWKSTGMSHAEHVGLLLCKRYIVRYIQVRCSARYILKIKFNSSVNVLVWTKMREASHPPTTVGLPRVERRGPGGAVATRRGVIRRSYGAIAWRARATMSFGAA